MSNFWPDTFKNKCKIVVHLKIPTGCWTPIPTRRSPTTLSTRSCFVCAATTARPRATALPSLRATTMLRSSGSTCSAAKSEKRYALDQTYATVIFFYFLFFHSQRHCSEKKGALLKPDFRSLVSDKFGGCLPNVEPFCAVFFVSLVIIQLQGDLHLSQS